MRKKINMHYNPLPTILIILFLIISVYVGFGQVVNHEFINLDDDVFVTKNPFVKKGISREGFFWAFTTTHTGLWMPLAWLSLMLDFEIYGLNAGGYHLTNLLIHIINVLLLFLVLKRMTGSICRSAFIAALFGLHPLRVESVAWIAERKDVLSTLFFMLTIWSYANYVESPNLRRYTLVFLTFAMGLMAKPMFVTIPFVLLLLDYWPFARFQSGKCFGISETKLQKFVNKDPNKSQKIFLALEKVPFFILTIIFSILAFFTQIHEEALPSSVLCPFRLRISNALVSYIRYIVKMIWPGNLAVFYPFPNTIPMWQVIGALLSLLCISAFVIWKAHRPYLIVGWLWYLGILVPVIGLVQVGSQSMADRYTYVPLIGLFIIIAWGIPDILNGWRYRNTFLFISSGTFLSILIICTRLQVRHWQDSVKLCEHTLNVTHNNWKIHYNLGLYLVRKKRIEEGITHYIEALRIMPGCERAHNNLGTALFQQGKIKEAILHYSEAIRLKPDYSKAHLNLGIALAEQGKIREAIVHYTEAIRLKPDYEKAHFRLGLAYFEAEDQASALNEYKILKKINPDLANLLFNKILIGTWISH